MSRLTTEEIRTFKREGYLVKRGVMDPEPMARARERKWEGAPSRMKRDDPTTWFGPFTEEETNGEECENCRIGHTWKYREPAEEKWLVDMLANNPVISGWAKQLLGEEGFMIPERIRGIYCRLPMGDVPEEPTICHCDVGPDPLVPRVGVVGLIAPIPPNGGAFTVWPGTHRIIYDLITSTEGLARNEACKQRIIDFNDDPHVEGHGDAGDILFWHGLLAHTAGWNRSEEIQLREAVLCDYKKEMPPASDANVSYDDMWEHWSEEVRALSP